MVFEQMSPLIRQMDTRKMEIFGINFHEFEMVKILDEFGQVWVSFGQVWTSLDEFGRVWTSLDKFGRANHQCANARLSVLIWHSRVDGEH